MGSDKDFRIAMGRWRMALLTARGLGAGARHVGLLMIEHTNYKNFIDTGIPYSWLSEARLASLADLSDRAIRTARASLVASGAIDVSVMGGRGRGNTSVYGFNPNWLERTEADLKERAEHSARHVR